MLNDELLTPCPMRGAGVFNQSGDKQRMIITKRDTEILRICLEQKFLLLRQIARKFFPKSRSLYKVPARRVNLLMKHGYLRAVKPRVGHETLYLTTPRGLKHLKGQELSNGLRVVENVDLKTYDHDVWVTDVRIIMEQAPFDWASERILRKQAERCKVPDGMLTSADHNSFLVEIERTLKNKHYYERMFLNNWRHYKNKEGTLFLVARQTMIPWFKKLTRCDDNFYFATIYDLLDRGTDTDFSNKNNETIMPYESWGYNPGDPAECDKEFLEEHEECPGSAEEDGLERLMNGGAVSDPSETHGPG